MDCGAFFGDAGNARSGAPATRVAVLLIAMAIMMAGCATRAPPAEPAAPPAVVVLGPVIPLLDVPPTTDRVRVVPAPDGSVHVLVASNGPRVVREVVVSPSGEVQHRRIVLGDVSVSNLDAAFDRRGRLHALIDQEHLVFEQGVWHRSDQTPWQALEWRPHRARFVPNAPDLVWSFEVDGSKVGASGRWEIYGFGGMGAGIIWPWFTRGERAVVVADLPSGFGPWIVIDPEGPMDTRVTDATADDGGNVYLAYAATREGMIPAAGVYYVKLAADLLAGSDGVEWRRTGVDGSLRTVRAVKGTPLGAQAVVRGESAYRPHYVPYPPHFFGGVGALRMSTNVLQRPRALVVAEARDKWFGRGFPIQYVEFDDFRWSSPIEVGLADHAGGSLLRSIWDAYDLGTTGSGRTFVAWPTAQGIVGRWIDAPR